MMKRYFLVIFMVWMTFEHGECIDCHQCASKDGPTCLDPYNGDEMADNIDGCGDQDTHCSKFKIVNRLYDSGAILGDPRESVTVSRGCIRADNEGDYCRVIESDAGFMFKCICSTDNCNGAGVATTNLTLVVLTSLAALVWKLWT